jgi:SIR2-like domain
MAGSAFRDASRAEDYPASFSAIELEIGREALEAAVKRVLSSLSAPSEILQQIARWPFAGYITTNYDGLLLQALHDINQSGWIAIGNSAEDARKVSGDADKIIWHLHGALDVGGTSRLILTTADYAALYRSDAIPIQQLRGLMSQRRIVFFGFGFHDALLLRELQRVGTLTSTLRPLFAFVPRTEPFDTDDKRGELLQYFNVDAIPYTVRNRSHQGLVDLADVYGSFTLSRTHRYGAPIGVVPDHHPETTGLLIYNELALRGGGMPEDILSSLIRAYILAKLATASSCTRNQVIDEISARADLVGGGPSVDLIDATIHRLAEDGLVKLTGSGDWVVSLGTSGSALVTAQAATGQRLAQQFAASLIDRARTVSTGREQANRIAWVAQQFIADCIRRRALGVALTIYPWVPGQQDFQLVALLRTLPTYMEKLPDPDEAVLLSKLVRGVLSSPTDAEATYIGVLLQAVFAVHILGYDPITMRARREIFSQTMFLLDASTLIPYLAVGSDGHDSANYVVTQLRKLGCPVLSLFSLAEEVAEHARWALSRVDPSTGRASIATLKSSLGMSGARSNGFLEGLVAGVEEGHGGLDLWRYLDDVLGPVRPRGSCSVDIVVGALVRRHVECRDFDSWSGFDAALFSERDSLQDQIRTRRKMRGTFRHDRQVRAEAEALIVVREVRAGRLRLNTDALLGGYFVSNTRVIDEVAGAGSPITMRPDAVMQWLATLQPGDVKELKALTSGLLSELATRDYSIVDRSQLQWVFSPLTSRTTDQYREESERHQVLMAQRLGEDPERAFKDTDPLTLPIAFDNANAQVAAQLVGRLEATKVQLAAARAHAELSDQQHQRLAELEQQAKLRKRKSASQKRASKARQPK